MPMSCTATFAGYARPCAPSKMGGVRRIGFVNIAEMVKSSASLNFYYDAQGDDAIHLYRLPEKGVAAIETVSGNEIIPSVDEIADFWADESPNLINFVNIPRQGAVLESNLEANAETGVSTYVNTLTIPTRSLGAAAVKMLFELRNADCLVFVETYGGEVLMMGWENEPVRLTGDTGTTGANWGDTFGHDIVLTSDSEYPPLPLALVNVDSIIKEFDASIAEIFYNNL